MGNGQGRAHGARGRYSTMIRATLEIVSFAAALIGVALVSLI